MGDYEVKLESFNTLSSNQLTLKTDVIKVTVNGSPFMTQFISAYKPSNWLLEYDLNSYVQVTLEPNIVLAPYISYNDLTRTIFFNGGESSSYLAGK